MSALTVIEGGSELTFAFEDLLRFHGPGSPGGVAHAFKVMERAFPLLDGGRPPERRSITIATAFGGPGARDGFELVTRAVSDGRYTLDPSLARPERGVTLERFVFRVGTVTLSVRDGFVPDELIALVRREHRSEAEEQRLAAVKLEMAEHVMAHSAAEVYDAE